MKDKVYSIPARCLCCTESCKIDEEFWFNGEEIENLSGNWAISISDLKKMIKELEDK